jgi:hypothetical protein
MPMVGKTSTFNQVNLGNILTTTINSAPSAVFAQTWLSDTQELISGPSRFATLIHKITRRGSNGTDVPQSIIAPTFFGNNVTSVTYVMGAGGGRMTAVHNYEFWA